jgi:2,4-dienoyl-CoA reductase-like NADH-dependent reductase (Old Yellow Enzyme family)
LIAYQRARAKGGAGLIVVQVVAVHETARYTSEVLMGTSDDCIPHFRKLFDAIKAEGTRAFVQLFHPGRELLGRRNGVAQAAYSASCSPSERFRIVPRALTGDEIGEIVAGYGHAARRPAEASADGVEVVASHVSARPVSRCQDRQSRDRIGFRRQPPALHSRCRRIDKSACAAGVDRWHTNLVERV